MNIQAVRGMNDILPQQAPLWDYFESVVGGWLRSYGYTEIRLPIVEKTELFSRSIGEVTDIVEKEMYTFTDNLNGESLTLRPEGTASCVRAVLQHNLLYPGPQRLFYTGPMFRHERPQKGRYRQFHQVGIESLGFADAEMDAEHLFMTDRLWRELKLEQVELQINTLGSNEDRIRYRQKLQDYLSKHLDMLDEDARRRLHSNPLRILDSKNPALREVLDAAPRMLDEISESALKHFDKLQTLLRSCDIAYSINPHLVRGLDYYNFTVFEWVTNRLGAQGTICAGGRYDGLIEQLGGKPQPACGFAMGVERVLALLEAQQFSAPVAAPHIYIVHAGEAATTVAVRVAETIRDAGLNAILHCGGGSFKSQMKKADNSGAPYAVIIGEDEVAVNQVTLKPLRDPSHQQERVALEKLVDHLIPILLA